MILPESIEKVRKLFSHDISHGEIGDNNLVYQGASVNDEVKLGKYNTILPGTIIVGDVELGDNNIIGPNAVIGTPAQHRAYYEKGIDHSDYKIKIGNHNVIREFVTVHSPTLRDTEIGDNCLIMAYGHVPHDAIIRDDVTITNCVEIAGKSTVMKGATIGLNSAVHQYSVIGSYAMVGLGSMVTRDIPPFLTYIQDRGCHSVNEVGMERNGYGDDILSVYHYYLNKGPLPEKLDSIMKEFEAEREANRKLFEGEFIRNLARLDLDRSYKEFLRKIK